MIEGVTSGTGGTVHEGRGEHEHGGTTDVACITFGRADPLSNARCSAGVAYCSRGDSSLFKALGCTMCVNQVGRHNGREKAVASAATEGCGRRLLVNAKQTRPEGKKPSSSVLRERSDPSAISKDTVTYQVGRRKGEQAATEGSGPRLLVNTQKRLRPHLSLSAIPDPPPRPAPAVVSTLPPTTSIHPSASPSPTHVRTVVTGRRSH